MAVITTSAGTAQTRSAAIAAPRIHPILAKIADYLRDRPGYDAIDPAAMAPELLPHIFILDIEAGGAERRLRIRLTGTGIDVALDRSVGGKYLEDFLHGAHSAAVLAGFHACADRGEPIWMRQVVKFANRAPRYVEGIAYRIGATRIYGGLLFGEVSNHESSASFESRLL